VLRETPAARATSVSVVIISHPFASVGSCSGSRAGGREHITEK
jgi:hypothetical protein